MNVRTLGSSVAFFLLHGCGVQDADYALKAKQGENERGTVRADSVAPSAADGWTLRETSYSTPHPYSNRAYASYTVTEPGADYIRLHFKNVQLETGYDWLIVSTPDGSSAIRYTGILGEFWTASIPGPSARIELVTDSSIRKYGFDLVGYAGQKDSDEWKAKSFVWHTQHPYRNGAYQVVEIAEPEAVKMKIVFGELRTEENYDFVYVYDEVGRLVAEYSGNLGKLETPAFPGKKLWVVFSADESITDVGVSIAEYSYVSEATEEGCFCAANFDPVCGVNSQTYSNACQAGCAQVAVQHPGTCGVEGDFCGGIAGLDCAEGFTCEYEGTWPDAGGSCRSSN